MLSGARGPAVALAMRIVVELGGVVGAERLIPIDAAHVDGCLYHGSAGLAFAERLLRDGARVAVPTTLNVGALDLLHPELYRGDPRTAELARRQMDAYLAMGCRPTWTCAPYLLPERPAFGRHVAWAESNAIVFCNSVLGARTDRYGDFIDVCAALTGRAPFAGLHRDERRRARIVMALRAVPDPLLRSDALFPVLGHLVGREAGALVPAIVGLPTDTTEDRLQALGAAAASSGAVAMFHAVGITPEAPTLEAALGGVEPSRTLEVTPARLVAARDELSTAPDGPIGAVCVGTPHLSLARIEELGGLLRSEGPPRVPVYASAGRDVLARAERGGLLAPLREAGVTLVSDTCTYLAPIVREVPGPIMTDSAKWAWYAPGNIGAEVVLGSLRECVRSAALGRVWRDGELWAA